MHDLGNFEAWRDHLDLMYVAFDEWWSHEPQLPPAQKPWRRGTCGRCGTAEVVDRLGLCKTCSGLFRDKLMIETRRSSGFGPYMVDPATIEMTARLIRSAHQDRLDRERLLVGWDEEATTSDRSGEAR